MFVNTSGPWPFILYIAVGLGPGDALHGWGHGHDGVYQLVFDHNGHCCRAGVAVSSLEKTE